MCSENRNMIKILYNRKKVPRPKQEPLKNLYFTYDFVNYRMFLYRDCNTYSTLPFTGSRTGSKFYNKIYSAKHGGEHFLLLSRGVDCNFQSFTGSNFKIKTMVLHVLLKILNFQTLTGSRRYRNGYNPNNKNDWDTNC